jgi:hypothetical protein
VHRLQPCRKYCKINPALAAAVVDFVLHSIFPQPVSVVPLHAHFCSLRFSACGFGVRLETRKLTAAAEAGPKWNRSTAWMNPCPSLNHNPGALGGGPTSIFLEQIPEVLVIYIVVILNFGRLHECAQQARTAIRRGPLQVGITALNIGAQKLRCPF